MTKVWRYHRKEFTTEEVQFPDGLLRETSPYEIVLGVTLVMNDAKS